MKTQAASWPTQFIFWCTAPFLLATLGVLAFARPVEAAGWILLGGVELLLACVLPGLYDPNRFWWCWRAVGALVFMIYVAYLVSMVMSGQWVGVGPTALKALIGLVAFGYPGFMFAVFGRLTWRPETEPEDDPEEGEDQ